MTYELIRDPEREAELQDITYVETYEQENRITILGLAARAKTLKSEYEECINTLINIKTEIPELKMVIDNKLRDLKEL
jgi:hypothetical protein